MDLWSDDPAERFAAAQDTTLTSGWPERIGQNAPMKPWPYGMPTSINPFVVFLGASPGNSPPVGDATHQVCEPYDLPTTGQAHRHIYCPDTSNYWNRVRALGATIVQAHAQALSEPEALALIGHLNLGTEQCGQAKNARIEPEYCRWVPDIILDSLRPSYVILLGLRGRIATCNFDPAKRLGINWNKPDESVEFAAYKTKRFQFRVWSRKRPDGKTVRFVQWPQHPSQAPMTNSAIWNESGREFVEFARGSKIP